MDVERVVWVEGKSVRILRDPVKRRFLFSPVVDGDASATEVCETDPYPFWTMPHWAEAEARAKHNIAMHQSRLKRIGRLNYPEHQVDRKGVEPGEALPCAAISEGNPRADHGSEAGGNRGTVAEVGRSPTIPIEFYRANEKPYGAFSNLYRCEIKIAGMRFPTVEHAYQSLKPRDPRVRDWLMAAPAPSLVALAAHAMPPDAVDPAEIMGRTADSLLGFHTRPGWSRLRYPWMFACLQAKFVQHEDLRALLLATGDRLLIEAGKIEDDAGRRWGIVNGRGQNYLGRMLMRVRAELRGEYFADEDLDQRLLAGVEFMKTALAEQ